MTAPLLCGGCHLHHGSHQRYAHRPVDGQPDAYRDLRQWRRHGHALPRRLLSLREPASPWRSEPSRAGFTFTGWNDGTNPYAAGSTYTMGLINVTLTAQWTCQPDAYRDLRQWRRHGHAPTQAPVSEGASFTVAANSFTRAGFTFTAGMTAPLLCGGHHLHHGSHQRYAHRPVECATEPHRDLWPMSVRAR